MVYIHSCHRGPTSASNCNFSFSSGPAATTVVPVRVLGVVTSKAECAVPVGEAGEAGEVGIVHPPPFSRANLVPLGDVGAVFQPAVPRVCVSVRVKGVSNSKPWIESRVSLGDEGMGKLAMEWLRKAFSASSDILGRQKDHAEDQAKLMKRTAAVTM